MECLLQLGMVSQFFANGTRIWDDMPIFFMTFHFIKLYPPHHCKLQYDVELPQLQFGVEPPHGRNLVTAGHPTFLPHRGQTALSPPLLDPQ